jgi:hypothetical protein
MFGSYIDWIVALLICIIDGFHDVNGDNYCLFLIDGIFFNVFFQIVCIIFVIMYLTMIIRWEFFDPKNTFTITHLI